MDIRLLFVFSPFSKEKEKEFKKYFKEKKIEDIIFPSNTIRSEGYFISSPFKNPSLSYVQKRINLKTLLFTLKNKRIVIVRRGCNSYRIKGKVINIFGDTKLGKVTIEIEDTDKNFDNLKKFFKKNNIWLLAKKEDTVFLRGNFKDIVISNDRIFFIFECKKDEYINIPFSNKNKELTETILKESPEISERNKKKMLKKIRETEKRVVESCLITEEKKIYIFDEKGIEIVKTIEGFSESFKDLLLKKGILRFNSNFRGEESLFLISSKSLLKLDIEKGKNESFLLSMNNYRFVFLNDDIKKVFKIEISKEQLNNQIHILREEESKVDEWLLLLKML